MTDRPDSSIDLDRAARLVRDGRFGEAQQAYSAGLAENPDQPEAWFNLAWLQRASRAFDGALISYSQAIAHGVARPEEAFLNRATILSEHFHQTEAAVEELRAALSLNPGFVQGWLNLGSLYEDLGKSGEAGDAYRRVVALEPGNGRAHGRLGVIEAVTDDPGRAIARLKEVLQSASNPEDRAEMLFALGTALDAQRSFDDAFQAFEAANWLARSVASVRYDPAAQERLVDRLIGMFPHALAPASCEEIQAPLFICGMFRSGSTLAEQILGRHRKIIAAGELDFIPALVMSKLQPYPEALGSCTPAGLELLRDEYRSSLAALDLGAGLVTDKRCDNFIHIALLKGLFPTARIVNTVRRPLDNLLSIYFLRFGEGVPYGHDLREATHYYIQYRRLMDHWRRVFGEQIHDFDYDKAVVEPHANIAELLSFIDVEWDEACLATATGGAVRTASAWQVRQPLFTRSSGRWRNYEQHLREVRMMLAAAGIADGA
ncbi:MAG TPA: sulfotransferase [Sphingomonas sp.]|nr:sulfotransferase [Sphingomonas sp.]